MSGTLFTRQGNPHSGAFVIDDRGAPFTTIVCKCPRCGGAGGSDRWKFTGYTCFECGGNGRGGTKTIKLYTAEKLAKLNATKAKADARRAAVAQAKAAAEAKARLERAQTFREANAAFLSRAAAHMANEFIGSVISRALEHSEITPAQLAAVTQAMDRIENRHAIAAASQHVGEIGKRLELAVTVERVSHFARNKFHAPWVEETIHVVTMRDGSGNCIVSMSSAFCPSAGSQFTLRATVKEHSEYRGQKQTKVIRALVIEAKKSKAA